MDVDKRGLNVRYAAAASCREAEAEETVCNSNSDFVELSVAFCKNK